MTPDGDFSPDLRRIWAEDQAKCWICGFEDRTGCELHTHEIACGPFRKKALTNAAAWVRICMKCHLSQHGIHNYADWPIARQLALKKKHDPENYDRIAVNRLRCRADEAITEDEVDACLDTLR